MSECFIITEKKWLSFLITEAMYEPKSVLNIETGLRIKKLRIKRNWAQAIVAGRLGISVPALSKIESGATDVNFARLEQIAHIFKINVVQLFDDYPEQQSESGPKIIQLLEERENDILRLKGLIISLQNELFQIYVVKS